LRLLELSENFQDEKQEFEKAFETYKRERENEVGRLVSEISELK
jgi:hypothetical protein